MNQLGKMRRRYSRTVGIGILILSIPSVGYSANPDHFDYPELSVVPRASDRLQTESAKESGSKMTAFLPVQVSALATLTAGIASYNSQAPVSSYVGLGVGGAWLLASTIMMLSYHPYSSSIDEITAMPKGSPREQLARERAAEEVIKSAAKFGERIKWLSVITNFGASLAMFALEGKTLTGSSVGDKNMTAEIFMGASAVLALTPLLFKFHWTEVADEQADYKKRIYGPVAQPTILADVNTRALVPGVMFSLRF